MLTIKSIWGGYMSASHCRSTLFAYRKAITIGTWATSTFVMLAPTLVKLIPLGNADRDAKGQLDDAKSAYDSTAKKLYDINAHIHENEQRILNLDCAMAGYQGFNHGVAAFQQRLTDASSLTPVDRLRSVWQFQFDADKTETEHSSRDRSWDTYDTEYNYYYSCFHTGGCDDHDQTCCSKWDYETVTNTHYYTERTTIEDRYRNILVGTPLNLPALDCGYYSRQFHTNAPVTYVSHESDHQLSGSRESGTTYVDYYREYASRVSISYTLDGNTVNSVINVIRDALLIDAASNLDTSLQQFLGYAIAAFDMAGSNYLALQDGLRQQIPLLIADAANVNATLQHDALVLADRQNAFDGADGDYKQGLLLWLLLLLLVPGGLALIAFLITSNCGKAYAADEEHDDHCHDDVEAGAASAAVVPAASVSALTSDSAMFGGSSAAYVVLGEPVVPTVAAAVTSGQSSATVVEIVEDHCNEAEGQTTCHSPTRR